MTLDRKQSAQIALANQHPLDQAAATFLRKTDWGASPTALHCLSLMLWGLHNGIRTPTINEPAGYLLDLSDALGPLTFTRLTAGETEDEANLTAEDLLVETDPLDAAAALLESLLANRMAGL